MTVSNSWLAPAKGVPRSHRNEQNQANTENGNPHDEFAELAVGNGSKVADNSCESKRQVNPDSGSGTATVNAIDHLRTDASLGWTV